MLTKEQLQIRKQGIGGSEVASVLGIDPFGSPYGVWMAKTGRSNVNVENKYTEAGRILEDAVAQYFAIKTGYKDLENPCKTFTHPNYSFAKGSPDRIITTMPGILECKTTQRHHEDPPLNWFCQLQWYLGVMQMDKGAIAWLERGIDFQFREYQFDDAFFTWMIGEVEKFWNENVLKDIAPDPVRVEDVEKIYSRHTDGKVVIAGDDMLMNVNELTEIRANIKALEQREDEIVKKIKMYMLDAETMMYKNDRLVTWKTSKPSKKFDADAFAEENPGLYQKYLVEKEGSRRFLVK